MFPRLCFLHTWQLFYGTVGFVNVAYGGEGRQEDLLQRIRCLVRNVI